MSRFSVGKLPGWAKTKLAAEDNAGQVILVSVVPKSIFWFFVSSLFSSHLLFPQNKERAGKSRWAERGEFLPFQVHLVPSFASYHN